MKLKNILLGLVIIFCTGSLHAQNATKSVVYLKNGSIIKCDIMEWQNDTIKFKTSDGSLFVYSMKEVEKISNTAILNKNENSDANKPQVNIDGKIVRNGTALYSGNKRLTLDEIRNLVSEDAYNTYLSATGQVGGGTFFIISGLVSAGAGIYLVLNGKDDSKITTGWILCGVGDLFLPLGCVMCGVGNGRIGWVAEQCNNGLRTENTISISPSIFRYKDIATSHSTYALGATLSINF